MATKQKIRDLSLRIKEAASAIGLPYSATGISEDISDPPRSFNLASALHHHCGTAAFVYESNQSIDYGGRAPESWETKLSYHDILRGHYLLFEQIIKFA